VTIFFRALARGVMSVVAPVTAVTAAAVPVLVGFLSGDRIGPWVLAGIALALVAIVLVPAEGGLSALRQVRPASLWPALLAGAMFGVFYVLPDGTADTSGLTPLLPARLAGLALVLSVALAARKPPRVTRAALSRASPPGSVR
jgi:drug/metabolite transporter (DMT)-like permease